jgi:hypothetical protein
MEDVQQEVLGFEPEPKKKLSGWVIALIIVAALVVICCVCAILSALLLGPVTGEVFSTILETVEAMTPVP